MERPVGEWFVLPVGFGIDVFVGEWFVLPAEFGIDVVIGGLKLWRWLVESILVWNKSISRDV